MDGCKPEIQSSLKNLSSFNLSCLHVVATSNILQFSAPEMSSVALVDVVFLIVLEGFLQTFASRPDILNKEQILGRLGEAECL